MYLNVYKAALDVKETQFTFYIQRHIFDRVPF